MVENSNFHSHRCKHLKPHKTDLLHINPHSALNAQCLYQTPKYNIKYQSRTRC
jgi:hypothetical protein